MITPKCSKCSRVIPPEDVNVSKDIAYCRVCNLSLVLSTLTHGEDVSDVDLDRPPQGAWQRSDGFRTVIGATQRSVGGALGLLAISLFWNGIVSVFVALALASTLALLGLSVPGWFPNPIMNGSVMGVGITLFLWLFLTPFILVGAAMIAGFVMALGGRTEVQLGPTEGVIFTGIGSLGVRKRFNVDAVKDVRIEDRRWRDSDGDSRRNTEIIIECESGKPVKFASSLTEERRRFMAAALRKAIVHR